MTLKPVIAVDVDLTVVDTLASWIEWYEFSTGLDFPWDRISEKSVNKLMAEHMFSPLNYWQKEDLYDDLQPIRGSVEVLEKMTQTHRIVFVTKSTAGHLYSKAAFLNRNFPFHSGIVNTSDKGLVEAEVFIEDYVDYVEKIKLQRPNADILFMRTKANEHLEVNGVTDVFNWREIDVYFNRSLNRSR